MFASESLPTKYRKWEVSFLYTPLRYCKILEKGKGQRNCLSRWPFNNCSNSVLSASISLWTNAGFDFLKCWTSCDQIILWPDQIAFWNHERLFSVFPFYLKGVDNFWRDDLLYRGIRVMEIYRKQGSLCCWTRSILFKGAYTDLFVDFLKIALHFSSLFVYFLMFPVPFLFCFKRVLSHSGHLVQNEGCSICSFNTYFLGGHLSSSYIIDCLNFKKWPVIHGSPMGGNDTGSWNRRCIAPAVFRSCPICRNYCPGTVMKACL